MKINVFSSTKIFVFFRLKDTAHNTIHNNRQNMNSQLAGRTSTHFWPATFRKKRQWSMVNYKFN